MLLRCHVIDDDVGGHVLPCRALCLLKPWWTVLGSRYPSTMYINYPDTSVSGAPSLSFPLSFQSPPSFQVHAFLWCDPGKQVAVDEFFSLVCAIPLLLLVLPRYFSSQSMISLTSSVKTTFQRPSAYPSSVLKLSNFHIRTAIPTRHNSIKPVVLSISWFCGSIAHFSYYQRLFLLFQFFALCHVHFFHHL